MNNILQIKTPRWAIPLLKPKMRYRGASGGRGSGKSHFFAEYTIDRCIEKKTRFVCLRETQNSLKESVKKLLEIKIQDLNVGHLFDVLGDSIRVKNGGDISFMGLKGQTAESIKSLEGIDVAWIEEAQSVSQRSLDIVRPTIRKDGSEIWASWNPRYKTDPIEFLRLSPPKGTSHVHVNFMDNPWISESLLAEMEYDRGRDIDKYNHIWLGEYQTNSESRVFKNWRVEEFTAPTGTIFKQGADWGFTIDPTVLVRCYISGRTLFIDYEAYKHNCEIFDIPHLFSEIPDSHIYPIVADSSRPETISYLKKNGYPRMYSSAKGAGSVEDGIEWLKSFDIVVHPRCTHTISELTHYCYVVDRMTEMITGKLPDKKNHVIDSLRYACEAVRKIEEKKSTEVNLIPIRSCW